MKILKPNKFRFVYFFICWSIPILFVLGQYLLLLIFTCEVHLKDLLFLAFISLFAYFLFFEINHYLYDKDTLIEIDANGNVTYSNMNQKKHFHLEDIYSCMEFYEPKLGIGFTEIMLKDGYNFKVSSYISIEVIYKMNPNIKYDSSWRGWAKILRREE